MKYRKLGKTGLRVPVVGAGTWQYCGDWGKTFTADEVKNILDYAKANGVNLIDTAGCYGNHVSEKLIGKALGGKKDDWIVVTKFGHAFNDSGEKYIDFSAAGVKRQLEASLESLGIDYVDVLLFHSGTNEELDNQELWTMLDKQKKEGKVKHLGVSLHPVIYDNVWQTKKSIEYGVEVIEVLYNRLERIAEDAVMPLCKANDIGVIGRVPLCSGYLSGKYNKNSKFGANDVRESYHVKAEREEKLSRAEIIQQYEVPKDMKMAQWAMAWCLQNEAVSTIVGGFKTAAQLDDAVRAADLDMVSPSHPLAAE